MLLGDKALVLWRMLSASLVRLQWLRRMSYRMILPME